MAIKLQWDQKFDIGHERLDFEHRIFLGLIRDLSVQADITPQDARCERILRELYKYAEFHFVSEENIMVDIGYPALAEHQQSHGRILAQFKDMIHQYRAAQCSAHDIVTFLFQWFALHTTTEDKRISEFIVVAGRDRAPAPAV